MRCQIPGTSVHRPYPGRPRSPRSNGNRHHRNPTSRIFTPPRPRPRGVSRFPRPDLWYKNSLSSIRRPDGPTRFHPTTTLSLPACNSCSTTTCSPRFSPPSSHSVHSGKGSTSTLSHSSRTHSSCNPDSLARRTEKQPC